MGGRIIGGKQAAEGLRFRESVVDGRDELNEGEGYVCVTGKDGEIASECTRGGGKGPNGWWPPEAGASGRGTGCCRVGTAAAAREEEGLKETSVPRHSSDGDYWASAAENDRQEAKQPRIYTQGIGWARSPLLIASTNRHLPHIPFPPRLARHSTASFLTPVLQLGRRKDERLKSSVAISVVVYGGSSLWTPAILLRLCADVWLIRCVGGLTLACHVWSILERLRSDSLAWKATPTLPSTCRGRAMTGRTATTAVTLEVIVRS